MPKEDPEEQIKIMAATGRETILRCLCLDATTETTQQAHRWQDAAEVVSHVVVNELEVPFTNLARKAFMVYFGTGDKTPRAWEKQPVVIRLAWEAAVRNMVNVRMAEDAEDLRDLNQYDWKKWMEHRLQGEESNGESATSE